MNFDDLADLIIDSLKKKIASYEGLSIFEEKRLSFEDWLKVEICHILKQNGFTDITPEFLFNPETKERIDITISNRAIELKNIPTQVRTKSSNPPRRSIAAKKTEILDDIKKLNSSDFAEKIIIFLVYPVNSRSDFEGKGHLKEIEEHLKLLKSEEFKFSNGAKGIIYIGLLN